MIRPTVPAALAAAALVVGPAASATAMPAPQALSMSVLATTDVHGHALNWDYFTNAPYPAGEELGLDRAKTVVDGIRQEKGEESVLLFDNGDSIQGNPLTSYFSATEPVTESGRDHPMAVANNLMGYDAQVVGNHEYNYGLGMLDYYEEQADFPVIAANAIDTASGEPYSDPTTMIEREIDGETVTVGVVGLTTPGSRIWDKKHLDGAVEFEDMVTSAQEYAPQLKEDGADVVVALAHGGKDPQGQEWDPSQLQENVSRTIAEQVPEIDVLVAGHSHLDEPSEVVTQSDGTQALITQPDYWARSVSEVELTLVPDEDGDGLAVDWDEAAAPSVTPHYLQGDVAESQEMADALSTHHDETVDYVNQTIAQASETMSTETSRYEDTAILDFIGHVMTEKTQEGLAGTQYEDLPVLAQTSPFSRDAVFSEGDVTVRDVAALYVFDNTLSGVQVNGAELKDYLEHAARFYDQVEEGADFDPEEISNSYDEADGRDIPDYAYDALTGVDYDINISKPLGERIENIRMADGTEVAADDEFVLAINNYRQSGGSGYPVDGLDEVYNEQVAIREALIDWAVEKQVIDPDDFHRENWLLTSESIDRSEPEPTDDPTDGPSGEPTDEPSDQPSDDPTDQPSDEPSEDPSDRPEDGDEGDDGRDDAGRDDDSRLPRTGAEFVGAIGAAIALAGLGTAAVIASRRRR
ncbi:5'-nucleotidase C-terminal domain-containing protein [Brevibacterium jeotgali]|uniref:2',3'-cyclic-nucleotide 2'-phosphodiesterase / 3'-nucleotidase n=1 Tax=Brevibacterium jeotgali TaxID=1262550 RepID=A0A2H1L7Y1_9MICO|nr:5'-nucleotidase C-terminal domain-containing protein [Brevibacterium jeotgali]TWC03333.1 2',3'-cyclic-nucleotide 2'-phosphodiesterase/3'-nucleotidase [Brevibacterium jeotgali]SMY12992.1 2',3'-cyclic-nucleotide 2'-phosphodiesterase / 3'-nucleotidase [Brevibacterium jeotgali]